jgi:signal transduction histidine kinase
MTRSLVLAALSSASLFASATVCPAATTSPLAAREMLEVAVLALKGDKESALAMFNDRHNTVFRHGDLFVFCADAQGRIVAHGLPTLIGKDFNALKDKTGKEFGRHMLVNASEGEFAFTGYYLPRANSSEEIYREDYFTKVRDLTCGAGYYTTKTE